MCYLQKEAPRHSFQAASRSLPVAALPSLQRAGVPLRQAAVCSTDSTAGQLCRNAGGEGLRFRREGGWSSLLSPRNATAELYLPNASSSSSVAFLSPFQLGFFNWSGFL